MKDISLGGIAVILRRSVAIGTLVVIAFREGEITAVVKHACAMDGDQLIGLEFASDCKDSTVPGDSTVSIYPA